jgi:NADH-quinone oxidoreductase subunit N
MVLQQVTNQVPEWTALAPALVLAATALLLLIIDSIDPDSTDQNVIAGTAVLGTLTAFGLSLWYLLAGTGQVNGPIRLFSDNLVVDGMALFFTVIFTSVATLVVLASYDYIADEQYQAEYYSLVLLAATGMVLMAMANSFAAGFVSLELASLPSYGLVAYLKHNRGSVEGGLKYFLIGALSSAIFAYGLSLVYATTGHLQFDSVANALNGGVTVPGVLGIGILMLIGGFAFKTASVPFHFWAPEAYEGAPAPISAFLSSASKAAGFVLLFRVATVIFEIQAVTEAVNWVLAVQILAVVTMTLGNFAAATQENVKRMLAYSSVGHAGYVLIGLGILTESSQGDLALGASMMHLFVYGFMNTGAFLFIAMAEYWDVGRTFEDYNGLSTEAPVACAAMTIFLFSLAGLPVGAGFLSKYVLLTAAISGGTIGLLLAVVLLVNSALSLYYYSRVVKAMWIESPNPNLEIESYPVGLYTAVMAAAVATVALLFGFGFVSDRAVDVAGALL